MRTLVRSNVAVRSSLTHRGQTKPDLSPVATTSMSAEFGRCSVRSRRRSKPEAVCTSPRRHPSMGTSLVVAKAWLKIGTPNAHIIRSGVTGPTSSSGFGGSSHEDPSLKQQVLDIVEAGTARPEVMRASVERLFPS
jgi:hypothetical protein